jgi:[ribosomal protein S5]-alanine N-acetyltransferase
MTDALERLVSPRLVGERLTMAHLDDMCRLHQDPKVMRTVSEDGRTFTPSITRQSILANEEHWEEHGFGFWAFYFREDRRFLGCGGLKVFEIDGQSVPGLAYSVLSAEWGRGFATEMSVAMLRAGFETLDWPEVASWALPHNHASQRVMEKLGFRYERDFTFAGLPHRYYRLAAADWGASRLSHDEDTKTPR